MEKNNDDQFLTSLWSYFDKNRRMLPWRTAEASGAFDPYKILVSEIMLQQTQVARVENYFPVFVTTYPDAASLARAKLADLLSLWKGLGYNRRALYLRSAAKQVVSEYENTFPSSSRELIKLAGVGKNTAGAIMAYAFNKPELFIETNIRTVYIHHYFRKAETVTDKEITEVLSRTIDRKNPREFYWALMDYGTYLKQTQKGVNRKSAHYQRQSAFHGSTRQLRARVLFELANGPKDLKNLLSIYEDSRLETVVDALAGEGLIIEQAGIYRVAD